MTVKRIGVLLLAGMLILAFGYYLYLAVFSDRESIWLYHVLFVPFVSILVLGMVILLFNSLQTTMDGIQNDLLNQYTSINDVKNKMGVGKFAPKDVSSQVEELLKEVKSIKEKLDSLSIKATDEHELEPDDIARGAGGDDERMPVTSDPLFFESSAADETQPPSLFPNSVKDCLLQIEKSNAYTCGVKAETLQDGIFVRSEDGPFLLIEEDNKSNSSFFVIPRILRFTSTQDYDHYRRYYECANPSAGEVWIVRPAVVVTEGHEGEWKLMDKGQLKIET
jgi:hypothetical protein